MILLPHAKRIAHDSGRGMGLPGLYSGRFLFCKQHEYLARHIHSQVRRQRFRLARWHAPASRNPRLHQVRRGKAHHHIQER